MQQIPAREHSQRSGPAGGHTTKLLDRLAQGLRERSFVPAGLRDRRRKLCSNNHDLLRSWKLRGEDGAGVVSAGSVEVYGQAVLDPAALLEEVGNEFIVLGGRLVFMVATIGVNIVANFVSVAFDLSNLNPKRISFKTGGIIASFAALLCMPWNLYNSREVIAYFLGGLGAILGPFFGIMAVDYFALRKGRFSIPGRHASGSSDRA